MCRVSLKKNSFKLISRQINCFICSPPSVVPTKFFSLPWTATPAQACIGIASSRVPLAVAVPTSVTPCVDEPLQSLGPTPATTEPVPAALTASAAVAVRPILSPSSEASAVPCPNSLCAESNSASLGSDSAPTAPAIAPIHLDSDPLLAVAMVTSSAIQHATCLNSFLAGKQSPTLLPPASAANNLDSQLLKKYADLVCPSAVGPAWHLDTINAVIVTDPHASTLTPEATDFCQQKLL